MNTHKLFTITILLFLCSFTIAQTNVYHPFPDSNAVWRVLAGDNRCPITYYYEYTITGDYAIGMRKYKVIRKRGMEQLYTCSSQYIDNRIEALIREDTLKKRWYIISAFDTTLQEYLLCDFNVQVRDTVRDLYMCGSVVISSIDSVLVGKQYHKRINHRYGSEGAWIEGIGNIHGLLEECTGGYGVGSNLVCFEQDGSVLYPFGSLCEPVNVTEINTERLNSTIIYPNPIYDISVLKFGKMESEVVSLEIYNTLGMLLKTENIKGLQEISINKNDFPQGIFIYKLISEKGIYQTGIFITQ